MNLVAVAMVWGGMILSAWGGVLLLKPLSWLWVRDRRCAVLVLTTGLLVTIAGWVIPAHEVKLVKRQTQLDEFISAYQFRELHSIHIDAPPERVFEAIKEVTADEIFLFRTLTWIRRFGRPGPESILNAPGKLPLLDVATRTTFILLSEQPGHEIVLGTFVVVPPRFRFPEKPEPDKFKQLGQEAGFAIAAMNFLLADLGKKRCLLTSETRVYATDASTSRRFACYWRVIYPGSALIRRMWLRAVKRRAETLAS